MNAVVKAIVDLILVHVDFLEQHVKSLTIKNSLMYLKIRDLKKGIDTNSKFTLSESRKNKHSKQKSELKNSSKALE